MSGLAKELSARVKKGSQSMSTLRGMKHREPHPRLWLALGVALVVISQFRYGVGALAWLAPIGWLRYLRLTEGWRSRLLFLGAMWLAWSVAVLKIVTGSIPPIMAMGFGLPIGSVFAAAMLTYEGLRRRIDANLATIGFASLMVVAEWSLHGLMPFGTWGAAANTQLDQLALLQLASVTGLHGVSFLMYLVAGVLERALAGGQRGHLRRWAWGLGLALLVVVSAGQARLASSSSRGVDTVTVAAVGTDSRVGTEPTLPAPTERSKVEQGLVERTTKAARAGAVLVVWNEAAIMVTSDDEPAFLRRMGSLAADLNVDIVAAYVVPVQTEPLLYENKYIYLRADGEQDHTYFKHHPVPGEPAIRGTAPMPTVERDGVRIGGSICYDYDFPRQALGNVGVDLIALPSSDWRGIDPIHTEMARMRAIESGHGIVRSTRFGLSAGIDAQGRMRGFASHYDSQERVLVVDMPKAGVTTVYGRLGDWFPFACGVLALGLCARAGRRVVASRRGDGLVGSEPSGARSV